MKSSRVSLKATRRFAIDCILLTSGNRAPLENGLGGDSMARILRESLMDGDSFRVSAGMALLSAACRPENGERAATTE